MCQCFHLYLRTHISAHTLIHTQPAHTCIHSSTLYTQSEAVPFLEIYSSLFSNYTSFLCLCFRILTDSIFKRANHFYLSVPILAVVLMNHEVAPQRWPFTSFQNGPAMTQAVNTAISTDLVFLQLIFCASCPLVPLSTACNKYPN